MQELNGVIGVAKNCCFCCHELAGRLAQAIDETEVKFKFTVPGTSEVVFPWSPPLIGIPLQVIQYPHDGVGCEVSQIHCGYSEADPILTSAVT